jgi:hypothetical protein
VRNFRGEDFGASSYDLHAVTTVEIPRAAPSLSGINRTGDSSREARAIATKQTHLNSAFDLKVEVRPVEGIELSGDNLALDLHGSRASPRVFGQKALMCCVHVENLFSKPV